MIRKLIVTAVILGAGSFALFGRDACSYTKTMFGNVREAVRSEIDPQLQLETIRTQVDGLMPEIREHMQVVAEQVVEVRNRSAEIAEKESKLNSQEAAILALRSDLDSGNSEFTYRQVSYTRGEVERDLEDRFASYQVLESSVQRDQKILAARKKTLRANQDKLDTMMTRKQGLSVRLAELEARLSEVQANETVNSIEIDDTALSRVEDKIRQLHHDLDVREAMLETEGHVMSQIPVDEEEVPQSDVISQIDAHFGLSGSDSSADVASSSEL